MATVSAISATTGSAGASITITGTEFGASQGASTVTIGGLTQTIVSWSDTSIVFSVASDDTVGDCIVNIVNQAYAAPFVGPGQP